MRAVVFGPSPFMQAAQGVVRGNELGEQRVQDEQDRATKAAADDRRTQVEVLDLAQRRIHDEQSRASADARRSVAKRLRASPLNAGGRYGQPGDPVDMEHDYAKDLEHETRVSDIKRQLVAMGHAPEQAELTARYNVDLDRQDEEKQARTLAREKQQAEIDATRARTTRERRTAASETTGAQEGRDRVRVAGWALATMRAGEKDPDRLAAAALAMNPHMSPQSVAAAIGDAGMKWDQANKRTEGPGWVPDRSYSPDSIAPATPSPTEPTTAPVRVPATVPPVTPPPRMIPPVVQPSAVGEARSASPPRSQIHAWMRANPQQAGEDNTSYRARATSPAAQSAASGDAPRPTREQVRAWAAANPHQPGENEFSYKARAMKAFGVDVDRYAHDAAYRARYDVPADSAAGPHR